MEVADKSSYLTRLVSFPSLPLSPEVLLSSGRFRDDLRLWIGLTIGSEIQGSGRSIILPCLKIPEYKGCTVDLKGFEIVQISGYPPEENTQIFTTLNTLNFKESGKRDLRF